MKKVLLLCAYLALFAFMGRAQNNLIRQDTVITQSAACAGGISVCIDSFMYDDINNYRFILDGQPYAASNFSPCKSDTLRAYSYLVIYSGGETGPWNLRSWQVNSQVFSGLFTSLTTLLDSMRRWDPSGGWQLDEGAKIIYGVRSGAQNYSCQRIDGLARNGTNVICPNPGIVFRGAKLTVSPGFHQLIVVQNFTNLRDTVVIGAACNIPLKAAQSVFVGGGGNFCTDVSGLLGTPVSIANLCPHPASQVFFQTPLNNCIAYKGVSVGKDSVCLKVCDQYGVCDTTIFTVTVNPLPTFFQFNDTITVGLNRSKCDLAAPAGAITSYRNLCAFVSGKKVNFLIDSAARCVRYTGIAAGADTACMEVCTAAGCDTTIVYVTAKPLLNPPPQTLFFFGDTITTGLSRTKCDLAAPPGPILTYRNICSGRSGTKVTITVDSVNHCITYKGISVGVDTACIAVCSASGCDTTLVLISSKPGSVLPPVKTLYTFSDTITVGLSRVKCDLAAPASATTFRNVCAGSSGVKARLSVDPALLCVTYIGVAPGTDSACIEACNAAGVCDTTILKVTALSPAAQTVFHITDTIRVGGPPGSSYSPKLTIPTSVNGLSSLTIVNFCAAASGTRAVFTIDNTAKGIKYAPVSQGVDSACVAVCDPAANKCDTNYIRVVVLDSLPTPPPAPTRYVFRDTLTVGLSRNNCSLTVPSGNRLSFQNLCSSASGTHIRFSIDPAAQCVGYTAVAAGLDSACIQVCDAATLKCDTTIFYINGMPAPTGSRTIHYIVDSVQIGTAKRNCNIVLPAQTTLTFRNICPGAIGAHAEIAIDPANYCAAYTGKTVGTDSACFAFCNPANIVCDTTIFKITTYSAAPNPSVFYIRDTIQVGGPFGASYTPKLAIPVSPNGPSKFSIVNGCPGASGTHARFVINVELKGVNYYPVSPGVDSACIIVCDTVNKKCDTNYIRVVVLDTAHTQPAPPTVFYIRDTLRVGGVQGNAYTPKLTIPLTTNPAELVVTNGCPGASGAHVRFVINNTLKGVDYLPLSVGTDSACIIVCDTATKQCDTNYIRVVVLDSLKGPSGVVRRLTDTLTVGQFRSYCGLVNLSNPNLTIKNLCAAGSGTNISFAINSVNKCLAYTAIQPGLDSACVQVCDSVTKKCDTTYYIVRGLPGRVHHPIVTLNYVIPVDSTLRVCQLNAPSSANLLISNFCAPKSGVHAKFTLDQANPQCVTYTGLKIGRDTACLTVCDTTFPAICDTTYFILDVTPKVILPSASRVHYYRDTISAGLTRSKCDLPAADTAIRKFVNFCPSIVNLHVNFTIDTVRKCVIYKGVLPGIDSVCMRVCDTANICDTTYFLIETVAPGSRSRVDSVTVSQFKAKTYCPNTSDLQDGTVNKIAFCSANPVFNHSGVRLDSVTNCVKINGLSPGRDTACIIVCNNFGLCDTTTLYIKITPDSARPHLQIDSFFIRPGQDSLYCRIDSSGLRGAIDSIFNNCPITGAGAHSSISIDSVTHCLKIKGITLGRDTACVISCNKVSGLCDTLKLSVIVKNAPDPLKKVIAVNDRDSTVPGGLLKLNLYANDTFVNVKATTLVFLDKPLKGQVDSISALNGLIYYRARNYECGLDSFRYKVCAATLCDSATVFILIVCKDSIRVFNAISPNADHLNDALIIQGLSNYPNNSLVIYNRWGNEVYKTKDYQQDWEGTWKGNPLPDGTYFYILRDEAANRILKTGYIQIQR